MMGSDQLSIDFTKPPKNGMVTCTMENGDQFIHPERGVLIKHKDGTSVHIRPNGERYGSFPKAFRVVVARLAEMTSHAITKIEDKTEHILVFRGGGVMSCFVVKGNPCIQVDCLGLGFKYDSDTAVLTVTHSVGTEPLPLSMSASVGVSDVCDIFNHEITKASDITTHFLQNYNRGNQKFSYNDRGECIEDWSKLVSWPPRDRDGNPTTPKARTLRVKIG